MNQIYLTGDTHRKFDRIEKFCADNHTDYTDTIIILGDVGINYYLDISDVRLKRKLAQLPVTLFCIHGNHEERPQNISTYKKTYYRNGIAYYEEAYPNIIFAIDGEVYDFNNNQCLVLGGAYSIDKFYRLMQGWQWFESEQIPDDTKAAIENNLKNYDWNFDYVLTHTCPYDVMPTHLFMQNIDQSVVDNSTERWLQKLSHKIGFKKWYFGHFHDEWINGRYHMLFNDFIKLGE